MAQPSFNTFELLFTLDEATRHGAPPAPSPNELVDHLQRLMARAERRHALRTLGRLAAYLKLEGDNPSDDQIG